MPLLGFGLGASWLAPGNNLGTQSFLTKRTCSSSLQVSCGDLVKPGASGFTINSLHAPYSHTGKHTIAAACSDGCLRLLTSSGTVDKEADGAHTGAVIQVRWNHAGSALVTGGEDGSVKTWSMAGMLRATIATSDTPIYALAWNPDSTMVCSLP